MTRSGSLVILFAALLVLTASLWWATSVWALFPFGSTVFYRWSLLWTAVTALALLALPVTLLAALSRRARPHALRVSLACAAILLGFVAGVYVGSRQRLKQLEAIPARADPLIHAVQAFHQRQGRPPERLEDLVPGYIATIPATGLGGYPSWSYEAAPFVNHPDHSGMYGENAWALNLYVVGRPAPSYRMLYLPNQRYPSTAGAVGKWARLHY